MLSVLPLREIAEERDFHCVCQWLAKQAEARRIIELDDKDLKEEERNPVWLRDKGKLVRLHSSAEGLSFLLTQLCFACPTRVRQ